MIGFITSHHWELQSKEVFLKMLIFRVVVLPKTVIKGNRQKKPFLKDLLIIYTDDIKVIPTFAHPDGKLIVPMQDGQDKLEMVYILSFSIS